MDWRSVWPGTFFRGGSLTTCKGEMILQWGLSCLRGLSKLVFRSRLVSKMLSRFGAVRSCIRRADSEAGYPARPDFLSGKSARLLGAVLILGALGLPKLVEATFAAPWVLACEKVYIIAVIAATVVFGRLAGQVTAAVAAVMTTVTLSSYRVVEFQFAPFLITLATFSSASFLISMLRRQYEYIRILRAEAERANFELIWGLVAAVEAFDPYTKGHSERVSRLARQLRKALGMDEQDLHTLEQAALVHDIGKIHIGRDVLLKPGALTPAEYARVKEHPKAGSEILRPLVSLRKAIPIVLHHHERLDGSGYPDGLKGSEIPLGARILAVTDSFDAMTSNRPYREAKSVPDAFRELRAGSGRLYDAEVVEAFGRVLEDYGFEIAPRDHGDGSTAHREVRPAIA